ncbi:uncharacterized protein LOC110882730 [Helianthus annuus]|uniref:uncharacterized protein LOC110882730 n=1 Tax=Helianthus annuus TaxID=4232 RepID=UPI000B8EF689|nr:uncharacterized protein LOC110882730 [Helianthus annuus]
MCRLVPYLVTPEPKHITRFIGGLAPEIEGNVKASKPTTYRSVVDLSLSLTLDAVRNKSGKASDEGKRKREDESSHRSDKKKNGNSEHKKSSNYKKNSHQSGEKPLCKTCKKHHFGKCRLDSQPKPCGICKSKDHKTLECKNMKNATCYGCNEKGHKRTNCPKNPKKPEEAKKTNARIFQMNAKEAVQNDNVITGVFLINDVYARVLFDSGADKSFVDNKFSKMLNMPIKTLDIKYEVELADGTIETASKILDGCFISIRIHSFSLSLLPMKLAGFDIVIGMDWLSLNQAQISGDKKQVIIKTPYGESIIIQGDTQYGLPDQVSMLKASKCSKKCCVIYMAQVTIDEPKPKIEDIPVISEYSDVFPEELPADESLAMSHKDVQIDESLKFVEKPLSIDDRQVKKLRRKIVPIVKGKWDAYRGPEYKWEVESMMRQKYPYLFQ